MSVEPLPVYDKYLGAGVVDDLSRRQSYYISDWSDGIHSNLLPTASFLYFACLLPSIAFGSLNDSHTNGFFSVSKTIIAQAIGGILFSTLSTQPLVVLLSTAPLAITIKLVFEISVAESIQFAGLYAWVGIFNSIFLIIFGIMNLPRTFLRHSSPFLCETFGLFISIALAFDAIKALVDEFRAHYSQGEKDRSLLWLILLYSTVSVGLFFLRFGDTKLFDPKICGVIGDFALPISVIATSFLGSYLFQDVALSDITDLRSFQPSFPDLQIGSKGIGIAIPLGLSLAILMFIDQSISAAVITTSGNKLKKGIYFHSDIILLAAINFILSILGLPWIHGALPHTPMHAKALTVTEIGTGRAVTAIESRLAIFVAHVSIGLSYFMLPIPLQYIPSPVLYGLFLYLSITALPEFGFYSRIVTAAREFSAAAVYHISKGQHEISTSDDDDAEACVPSEAHSSVNVVGAEYLQFVPADIAFRYTCLQLCCLFLLCISGLYPQPYLNAAFPIILLSLMLFREYVLVPYFKDHLNTLDRTE